MGWTKEQLDAINQPGSLLVSASAGSGKTAVLTERIVRLVKEGTPVSRLLVVTYTKAAAAEMKKRIARELAAAAFKGGEGAEKLRAAADEIPRANISTIHSFLTQVLHRHFHTAGIDPASRVLDEAVGDAMREEALNSLIEDRCASDPAFPKLMSYLGGEEKFVAAVMKLYQYMMAQAEPGEWLARACARFRTDAHGLAEAEELSAYVSAMRRTLAFAVEQYAAVANRISPDAQALSAAMLAQADAVRSVLTETTYDGFRTAINGLSFKNLSYKSAPPDMAEEARSARTAFSDAVKEVRSAFKISLEEEAECLAAWAPVMDKLAEIMLDFSARFDRAKREGAYIDYYDMEHLTLELFKDSKIADEYRRRFDYIFVDEYQDANSVQERIINAIRREDNLFLVGDVKQSIYRFRLADPRMFIEKMRACDEGNGKRVDLVTNFRSGSAVIDAVNAVFSRVMSEQAGELEYDEKAALKCGITIRGSAQLHLIVEPDLPNEDEAVISDAQSQAAYAAELIDHMVKNELYTDPKTGNTRPYRYGDFAVLSRAAKGVADEWASVLARMGVPAYSDVTGGYFDAVEIQILMNLLRVIDNRYQDIPLVSVLRSPIGGFSTEELIELRLAGGGSLIEALLALSVADTAAGRRARRFIESLERWRADARLLSVEELVGKLMDETGFYDFVCALPGGERRLNLDAFVDRARSYEAEANGLHDFITFMDRISRTRKLGTVRTAGQDVVQILSVHRSKGLEYPVVLLAGLEKQINYKSTDSDILPDRDVIGLRLTEDGRRRPSLLRDAVRHRLRGETLSEELRVLYVGMTRAVEKLIMIGSVHDLEKLVRRCALPPSPAVTSECKSHLELLVNAIMDTSNGNVLREEFGLGRRTGGPHIPVSMSRHGGGQDISSRLPEHLYLDFAREAAAVSSRYDALFKWVYPYAEDTVIPAKVSVSELCGNVTSMRRAPDFVTASAPEATDRGTAAHALMEHISIAPHTERSVREELERLTAAGLITPEQAAAADAHACAAFFSTPLGMRMTASKKVERELEFNIRASARELMGAPTDETVLLQGVIDCCFLEDGGYIIIDYKTDRVSPGREDAQAARHRRQAELYAMALTRLTGLPVREKYIYFLRTGAAVRV